MSLEFAQSTIEHQPPNIYSVPFIPLTQGNKVNFDTDFPRIVNDYFENLSVINANADTGSSPLDPIQIKQIDQRFFDLLELTSEFVGTGEIAQEQAGFFADNLRLQIADQFPSQLTFIERNLPWLNLEAATIHHFLGKNFSFSNDNVRSARISIGMFKTLHSRMMKCLLPTDVAQKVEEDMERALQLESHINAMTRHQIPTAEMEEMRTRIEELDPLLDEEIVTGREVLTPEQRDEYWRLDTILPHLHTLRPRRLPEPPVDPRTPQSIVDTVPVAQHSEGLYTVKNVGVANRPPSLIPGWVEEAVMPGPHEGMRSVFTENYSGSELVSYERPDFPGGLVSVATIRNISSLALPGDIAQRHNRDRNLRSRLGSIIRSARLR